MTRKNRNVVSVHAVKIRWYRAADGRTFVDPRKYGRKQIPFPRGEHEAALAEARRIALEIHQGGAEVLALSAAERADFARIKTLTIEHNSTPIAAISEWSDCQAKMREAAAMLRGADMRAIFNAGLETISRPVRLVPDVVQEFHAARAANAYDKRYGSDLEKFLREFAASHPGDIITVTPAKIEEFLNSRKKRDGSALSATRRKHIRAALIMLFTFARERGYLPEKKAAPQLVKKQATRRTKPIGIFTPEEMATIMKHAGPMEIPWLVLAGFTGLRVEEIARSKNAVAGKDWLRWEDFDWAHGEINVRAEVSKTGDPRRCPIAPNVVAWLSPWRDNEARGYVIPPNENPQPRRGQSAAKIRADRAAGKCPGSDKAGSIDTVRDRFKRKLSLLAKDTDEITHRLQHWPHNVLRHSSLSYRQCLILDLPRLAYESGNSVAMCKKHYNNPRPKAEGEQWSSIVREAGEKVIQLDFATLRAPKRSVPQ